MKIEILHEAEEELNEAIAYYEEIEPGLGVRLKEEVRAVIRWIGDNPEISRLQPKGYRRAWPVKLNALRLRPKV
jgi:plasmid stabilization system protein ParE